MLEIFCVIYNFLKIYVSRKGPLFLGRWCSVEVNSLKQSRTFYVEMKRDRKSFKRSDHLNNCVNRARNAFNFNVSGTCLGRKSVSIIDVI